MNPSPETGSDRALLQVRGIAKLYGRSVALKATSFDLHAGGVLALLGPNGSGKTTLLKIVAGAITATLGSAQIDHLDMFRERPALRARIGLLAAETYLYDDLTACENLRFTATMAGQDLPPGMLHRALDEVGLSAHRDDRVRGFSSGMKRRLALARTLLSNPYLLLLDEPYNSLDTEAALLVDSVVRRVAAAGGAVLLATHDADRALSLATAVLVLERGATRFWGTPVAYRSADTRHVG